MNIYESITKIIADCPAIAKDSRNTQGNGYMYRGIDAVMNVFQPLLAKYKIFVVPQVLDTIREERVTSKGANLIYSILRVKYTFFAEDGTSVEAVVQGEGMDSGDKASNKAMSAAFKYAMFQVFCIPTEEMKDCDAETPEESRPIASEKNEVKKASEKQIELLKKKYPPEMLVRIMKNNNIEKLEDLSMSKASEYIAYKGKENNNG